MAFKDTSEQGIEREVREYFDQKHGIPNIEYVSPCYRNAFGFGYYSKLIDKETEKLNEIKAFIRAKGCTEEDYNEMVKAGKIEEGMPTVTSLVVFSKPLSLE